MATPVLNANQMSPSDLTPAPLSKSSSLVQFAFQGLQPPSNLYVNVDDQLIISAATSQSLEVVTLNVRLLLPNGRIEDMQFQIRPANTRTVLKKSFALAEGFLLSMSASAAIAVTRGQTFARMSLQRSAGGAGQPAYCLMADYVTQQSVSGYPNGRIMSPTEGPGYVYTASGNTPAAGVDWQAIVPANARWRVRSTFSQFVASAAVANRQIASLVSGTMGYNFLSFALVNVTASQSIFLSMGGVTPYTGINTSYLTVALPPDLVLTGSSLIVHAIGSFTVNIQAADQWSFPDLLIEEWLDNV